MNALLRFWNGAWFCLIVFPLTMLSIPASAALPFLVVYYFYPIYSVIVLTGYIVVGFGLVSMLVTFMALVDGKFDTSGNEPKLPFYPIPGWMPIALVLNLLADVFEEFVNYMSVQIIKFIWSATALCICLTLNNHTPHVGLAVLDRQFILTWIARCSLVLIGCIAAILLQTWFEKLSSKVK